MKSTISSSIIAKNTHLSTHLQCSGGKILLPAAGVRLRFANDVCVFERWRRAPQRQRSACEPVMKL